MARRSTASHRVDQAIQRDLLLAVAA